MVSFVEALLGTLVGALLIMLGGVRSLTAPTPGGVIAGGLMMFSGVILAPHGRSALESALGSSMTRDDAASLFILSLMGSFGLNLLVP